MNESINTYINNLSSEQKEIMLTLRKLIHEAVPEVQESFKWSRPVFGLQKDFAYLLAAKSYVNLGFMNFQKIKDPRKLLEGIGKDMRHIKIRKLEDINTDMLREWLQSIAY